MQVVGGAAPAGLLGLLVHEDVPGVGRDPGRDAGEQRQQQHGRRVGHDAGQQQGQTGDGDGDGEQAPPGQAREGPRGDPDAEHGAGGERQHEQAVADRAPAEVGGVQHGERHGGGDGAGDGGGAEHEHRYGAGAPAVVAAQALQRGVRRGGLVARQLQQVEDGA